MAGSSCNLVEVDGELHTIEELELYLEKDEVSPYSQGSYDQGWGENEDSQSEETSEILLFAQKKRKDMIPFLVKANLSPNGSKEQMVSRYSKYLQQHKADTHLALAFPSSSGLDTPTTPTSKGWNWMLNEDIRLLHILADPDCLVGLWQISDQGLTHLEVDCGSLKQSPFQDAKPDTKELQGQLIGLLNVAFHDKEKKYEIEDFDADEFPAISSVADSLQPNSFFPHYGWTLYTKYCQLK